MPWCLAQGKMEEGFLLPGVAGEGGQAAAELNCPWSPPNKLKTKVHIHVYLYLMHHPLLQRVSTDV